MQCNDFVFPMVYLNPKYTENEQFSAHVSILWGSGIGGWGGKANSANIIERV